VLHWLKRDSVRLATVACCAASLLRAQRVRQTSAETLPIRHTVEEAEREGADYPRGATPAHRQTLFAGSPVGTAERKCVPGPTPELAVSEIRSGDFVIGGQIGGWRTATAGRQSKIWWVPYHNPFEHATKLLVRGARLGAASDTVRFTQPDWAWPSGGLKTDSFFPSGVTLPTTGMWLLIATAGDDWGCFILRAT